MTKGKEAGRIQVYVRVRPFTEKEKEKKEPNAIALHHDHSLIRVLDPRRETNYFFDGVFGPEASNYELYLKVGRPLVYAALNGYKGTLLTYGQTGTGKTYTLLSEDGVTTNVVGHCFERIQDDEIHSYKVTCSFLQVYQEKVYDLLNPRFTVELPVREHPKKGVYVANLTQNEVKSASDVLALLEYGKRQLVMAETKMVRHSSRSHSIMQLIIERRLKAHIAMEQASSEDLGPKSPETVHDSIMAVDETINNLLRELKQERKSHHRRERECLKELMEKELDDSHSFKGDVIVKGKINLCDLAGSERLTKTKAEGVRLTEAKYLNTSLLELGNVIHALARGKQRHVPYRNSTLTRLLQDCLGDNGKTNFIVCIAPSLSEVNETKCSLNFGLRAMRIINVARLNVEVDYKVLAERLAKKLEDQDHRHKLEKLEYLREIQRLNTAVTSYEESEHVVNSDTDTLVSVIQNLSKSVQREKEAKHSLQSELTCLKRKVSNSPTANVPEIEALFLAELMSMQLLTHVYQSEAVFNAVSQSDLPSKVREYMTSTCSQENMLLNTGYMLELLDSCLGFGEQEDNDSKTELKDHRPKITKAEQSTNQLSSNDKKQSSYVQNMTGGLKKMFDLLVGNKDGGKPDVCSTKSQHSGESTPEHKPQRSSQANPRFLVDPNQTMTKLVHTKEKVEKHVANLLLTAFGEQLICSQGNSPQWGVLGRKLSELIMFKRNNIIGIKDTEMWSNYENVANILESCFKYVLIDKALLASMIVIEHMDGRGSAHKHVTRLPSPGRALQSKKFQEDIGTIQKSVPEELSSRVANESISEKFQGSYNAQGAKENLGKSLNETASVSPSKQKTGIKGSRTTIEQEINEVFDDTSRLESELFATMEEKARLEDELIIMKDYVNKLKSDMFHLKIERANLESDFKKTARSIVSLSESAATIVPQKEFINNVRIVTEDYRGLRVGELSDVTEASHESTSGGESENGSHFSESHEQGSQVLKNCLASMAQMYSLMPNPDDDTLTEGDDSDGKGNGSLSEDDIGESEEENIIITKIAREMQDYHSPSVSSDKVKKAVDLHDNQSKEQVNLESTKGIKLKANALKDALEVQRSNKTLKSLQIAYEDLEDELYHVRGQLSKAQQIILNLESQLNEEKANWEQIRKLYLEYKDKNDVLEGKVAILREELEKSLRENTFLKDYHKVEVVEEGQNKGHSSSTKSPLKSPSRRKVFDLRSIPSIQNSNREMQIIKLLEENTELRTKNEKLSEEKMLAEYHSKENETKAKEMEETVRYIEEQKRALKEEIEALQRRKVKLGNELLERREESLISSTELDLYSKESARLEKELSTERNMAAKLRNDNNQLSKNIERLQSELDSWKIKHIDKAMANVCGDNPIKKEERKSTEGLQMVFIDDSCSEEEEEVNRELKKTDSLRDHEDGKTVVNLQKEIRSMVEYHEALEKEYAESRKEVEKLRCDCQTKEERIHSLENEIGNLRKQMNITKATTGEPTKTIFSRLYMKTTPSKTKSSNEEFDVRERNEGRNQEPDYKNTDDEINTVKKENSQLRQKIRNSEQKLAIYEADLEKAMLKIKQLQEYRVNQCIGETDSFEKYIDPNLEPKDSDLENVSVGIGNIHSNVTEMKLVKANIEIERLREQLFDKEAEKSLLYDELHLIRLRKDELDKALDEAREARTELQEKMDEMAKCTHFEDTVKELTEKNQQLDMKLQQKEESALTATKKYEKQNEAFRKLEEELVCASGEKLKSEFELRNAVIEMEKVRNDLQQSKQDLKMLKIELNEKMERSANLEIQLLEFKCSNDCMKSEIDQLKEKKRQESHQSQEKNICKETMEKRLQEAFLANNQLQSELHNILEENKELNEKLCKALECKEDAEGEASQLQKQLLHLQVELNQTTSEKKHLEGKVKKLDETKRRIEDELKQLKENTNSLHSDLAKIERQQEETNKKCANLEKEIKRKTKELEGKQRDNRRLKKELSTIKEEKKLERESTVNFAGNSDEVQKLKAKTEFLEKENEDLHNKQMSRESANNIRDGNNQQGQDGSKISNIKKSVTFSPKDKYDVLNTAVCNEIGWDFENDTMAKEIHPDEESNVTVKANKEQHIEIEPQIKRDLSDEVGWDLNYIIATTDDDYCSQDNQGTTLDSFKVEISESATSTQFPKAVSNGEKSNHHNQQQQSDEEIRSINVQASVTQISKEKLLLESETARLLESQTSHLTKTQMSLEQSLSKALGENERLLEKLNDSRIILERIKSRVSKLEEENVSVSRIEAETQTTHIAEFLPKATQISEESMRSENEVVTPTMEEKENEDAISPITCEVSASSSKAILYLTREKKQVSKELETIKQSHEDLKKELIAKDKASLQLKQELNALKFSREEEKKSLSEDLEIMTANYHAVKRKLKEQEQHNTSCKELNEKQIQAEKLIVELEKDLMRQTEEKSSLKGKLSEYQNKLNELETTKKELQSLRNENKQMSDVLEAMGKHIESYKKENQELSERLERRKKSWNTISSRKNVAGKKKGISVTIERKKRSKGDASRVKERRKRYENTDNTQNVKKHDPSFESVSSEDTDSSDNENENDEINVMKDCKSDKTNDKQNERNESTSPEKQASTVYLSIQNETFDRIGENFPSILSESLGDNDYKIGIRLTKELNVEQKENQQTEIQDIKSCGRPEDLVDKELITSDPIVSTNECQIPLNDNKCTVGDDINIGDETDEEACIELKLSRILKERQTMEQEMQSMIQEINDLKAKFAQRQSEENSNEQEDCLLRMQLEKLLHEKTEIEKTVKTLKTMNTKLEIELSDVIDIKNAMEAEIMRIRTGSQEQQEKIEKMNENNTKLESALAILSEENSNLYQDVSTLREENRILKSYKIREIVDGSTQVSPWTIEDEVDTTNSCSTITTKIYMKSNDDTSVIKTSSPGFQNPPRSPSHEEKTKEFSLSKALLELPINSGGYLAKYPYHTTMDVVVKPLSASSPDTSGKEERGNLSKTGSSIDTNNSIAEKVKSQSQEKSNLKELHNYLATTPEEESESGYADSKCGNLICSQCRKRNCQCRSSTEGGSNSSNINQNLQNNAVENPIFDTLSNDLEPTGGEACTDSSFASVTDFEDISFSSDWVSTEDLRSGRVTSRGYRGLSKMHREIAEIKCTNTILENELTIMKNRNSDFQAQLQKLAGKNNSLKQKICDRTLVIKKTEREMAILTEEKMRLEAQVSASKEEITRLERERAKLERSLSNSKSENKRLKNDLAITRADNYKTMKTLVKLEAENKNLQLELEQTKEQLQRQTSVNMNTYLMTSMEKHQSCDSSKQNPEEALVSSKNSSAGMEGFSQDRAGLSLVLTDSKPGSERRVSSDQSFPKHNKGGDFISSSESDILSSPEDYPTQKRGPRHPCRSQPLPSTTKGAKTYTDTSALTQSEDPSHARTESQMSYSSDLGFPGDWDQESSQSDGGTGASCDVDDKKVPHGGIKKMFKKFTKPKKNIKSSSS